MEMLLCQYMVAAREHDMTSQSVVSITAIIDSKLPRLY